MCGVTEAGFKEIKATVKISNPKLVCAVKGKRRNVTVRQCPVHRGKNAPPAATLAFFLVERAPRDHVKRAPIGKNLLHIRHGTRGRMQKALHALRRGIDLQDAVSAAT